MAVRSGARREGASHARALALQALQRVRSLLVAPEADVQAVRRSARHLALHLRTAYGYWASYRRG